MDADRSYNPRPARAPMTLSNAVAAHVCPIVWCRDCGQQVELDPAEHVQGYGAETSILDWRERVVCSEYGSREINPGVQYGCYLFGANA